MLMFNLVMNMDYEYYDDEDDGDDGMVTDYIGDTRHHNLPDGDIVYGDLFNSEMPAKSHMEHVVQIFEACIVPSVVQILGYMITLVLSCILFRLFCWLLRSRTNHNEPGLILHIVSIICGLSALYLSLDYLMLVVIVISTLTFLLMQFFRYNRMRNIGFTVALVTIGSQFIYEFCWRQPEAWHRIRGVQMVANMKIISLAFDQEEQIAAHTREATSKNVLQSPHLVAYLGYIFCPATCALGPWVSYQTYVQSLRGPSKMMSSGGRSGLWIPRTLLNLCLSLVFLCSSNCIGPAVGLENSNAKHTNGIWMRYYIDALGVRCSHYFISFLAQAGLSAAGLSLHTNAKPHMFFDQLITKPWLIEFPRSLSSLVRCWNIPMHDWLKKYIYRPILERFGNNYLLAVLCTYLVSSLLHGVHIRIYLVLLSLGLFSYVELMLRDRLANIFDACIGVNPCVKVCTRKSCPTRNGMRNKRSWLVCLVNFCFSAVAILNLAYLGIMLTDIDDADSLWKWEQVDHLNHYIALFAFIFYLFIT